MAVVMIVVVVVVIVVVIVVVVVVVVVVIVVMVDGLVNVHGFLDVHGLLDVDWFLVHVVRHVDNVVFAEYHKISILILRIKKKNSYKYTVHRVKLGLLLGIVGIIKVLR